MAAVSEVLHSNSAHTVINCPALERVRLVEDVKATGRITFFPESIGCAAGLVPNLTIAKEGIVCKGRPCRTE